MNRFLREVLPKGLIDAQKKREDLERERWDIARKLDYDDEWGDHECDCTYCESNDEKQDPLSIQQREDLEKQLTEIDGDLIEHNMDIKRMIEYQKFTEKHGKE